MIKNATKTITSIILYSSLLLFGPNIYAADAPFQNNPALPGQGDDETPMYLRILLNRTFGMNPPYNEDNRIIDSTPNEENSKNLINGLIFLNPSDVNYIFASPKIIGTNAAGGAPWWFNQQFDVLHLLPPAQGRTNSNNNDNYSANPTIQSIKNSLFSTYTADNCFSDNFSPSDCASQSDYDQNRMNLIMNGSDIDPQKIDNLSITSLLDPLQYDTSTNSQQTVSQQDAAMNYMRLVSGALDITLDPQYEAVLFDSENSPSEEIKEKTKKAIANYNSQIFSYMARSSVIENNLQFLYKRRAENPDNSKSIKQIEYDMVVKKNDPDGKWRKNLENQSLKATMVEIAKLLAEQQAQSYMRGEENEQMIASMSTLLIQQQEFLKMNYYIDTDE